MLSGKYRVEVVAADYYRKIINCQDACPVHTSASGYIADIAEGDIRKSYIIARQPNPFASVCGRVCNAPCENACRRGQFDAPVAIRALKRFATERYGVEVRSHLPPTRARDGIGISLLGSSAARNSHTASSFLVLSKLKDKSPELVGRRAAKKVAVVGAGPAGLTAAHDLAILGYRVALFEAAPVPGGMLLLGVPEYRLPKDLVRLEIGETLDQGVELKCNLRLGGDFTLKTLREEGYEAIFLAIGAHKDQDLRIEGTQLDGVLGAVDFLLNVNLGYRVHLGEKVAVVGGGNVAVDAARSAVRFGDEATLDASRAALRLGAREVSIVYRRSRSEMPAKAEEIEEAEGEGIRFIYLAAPSKILGKESSVCGLECLKSTLGEPDATGRRQPIPIPGSEFVVDATTVVLAVGQTPDLSFLEESDNIRVARGGAIAVDPATLATTAPGIFAGGDVAFGPRIIIEAVRDGHKAARSIDQYLQRSSLQIQRRSWMAPISFEELATFGHLDIPLNRPPTLPLERRTGIAEVELGYSPEMAQEQALRCLRCNVQTVFNGELCILCGGCVDVCPQNCLKLVRLDKIDGAERLKALIQAKYGISWEDFQRSGEVLNQGTAMIKDETRCVRCGLCAQRCPVGAITMEAFWYEEELVYERSGKAEQTSAGDKI